MKNIFKTGVMAIAAVAALSSCSDWTDPEPVDTTYQGIGEADPDTYANYLANLRAYRGNGHKKAYAWFANSASFVSQADHILAVPDSIDVLVLHEPATVNADVLNEMVTKRSNTGMEMAYTIDYAAMQTAWSSQKEIADADGKDFPAWSAFMADSLNSALAYAPTYGFNRVILAFDGRSPLSMTPAELTAYKAEETAFLGTAVNYLKSHSVAYDYMGIPANLTEKSMLDGAGVIFLSESAKATNANELSTIVGRSSVSGVPAGKFGVTCALPVLDAAQASVGYWNNGYASVGTARWARQADGVRAIGMTNLYDGYYNTAFQYPACRAAIQTLNPSAK